MPFVHPITGQRLPDDAAHDHKFLFISMDTPQETEAVQARFPHLGWQDVNGTTVFQYNKAIAILCEMDDYVYDYTTDDMPILLYKPGSEAVQRNLGYLAIAMPVADGNAIYGTVANAVAAVDLSEALTQGQLEGVGFSAVDMCRLDMAIGPVGTPFYPPQ